MRLLTLCLIVFSLPALAQDGGWRLLSREDGCLGLDLLTKRERLSRTPGSPGEFAQMLRDRGEQPSLGLPKGFGPEMATKVIQVSTATGGVIFVTGDLCRQLGRER